MSNNNVKVYAADQVVISHCNLPINSGFSDGEFLMIELAANDYEDEISPDGEVVRWQPGDRRATIKIKMKHTSDGNTTLNALRNLDLAAPNGAGIGVFQVRDLNSGVLLFKGNHTWIQKPPAPSRGKAPSDCEWTLRTAHAEMDFSGNPSVP